LVKEYTPTGIVNTFTTNSLRQAFDIQIFSNDKIKFLDKPIRQLEIIILSLASDLQVQLGNLLTQPFPSFRTLNLSAENLLLMSYLLFCCFNPSWILQKRTVRKCQKVFQSNIYTDSFSCFGQRFHQRFFGNFQSESNKPTIGFASYPNMLDDRTFGQRAMPNNLNQPNILDIQPQPPALINLNLRAVTIGVFQGSKAVRFLKAGVANFLAFLKPIKEALEGFVKTAQDVLAGGKVKEKQFFIGCPQIFKFKGLFVVGDGSLFFFPSIFAFFKGVVVQSARYFQQPTQQPALRFVWFESILIGNIRLAHYSIIPRAAGIILQREGNEGRIPLSPKGDSPLRQSSMARVLKPNRYCAIFVADYRIARSRVILPLHADVIGLMQARGFDLFDLYVWRYYRSGGFRPFGAKPY
jgi:hypothetical protein